MLISAEVIMIIEESNLTETERIYGNNEPEYQTFPITINSAYIMDFMPYEEIPNTTMMTLMGNESRLLNVPYKKLMETLTE
jgi:hypothetical protein